MTPLPRLGVRRLDDSGGEPAQSAQPRVAMEHEKRIRREIANSNERRRMQSINAGFQALRSLLPQHEGEKLSKVCRQPLLADRRGSVTSCLAAGRSRRCEGPRQRPRSVGTSRAGPARCCQQQLTGASC